MGPRATLSPLAALAPAPLPLRPHPARLPSHEETAGGRARLRTSAADCDAQANLLDCRWQLPVSFLVRQWQLPVSEGLSRFHRLLCWHRLLFLAITVLPAHLVW